MLSSTSLLKEQEMVMERSNSDKPSVGRQLPHTLWLYTLDLLLVTMIRYEPTTLVILTHVRIVIRLLEILLEMPKYDSIFRTFNLAMCWPFLWNNWGPYDQVNFSRSCLSFVDSCKNYCQGYKEQQCSSIPEWTLWYNNRRLCCHRNSGHHINCYW